MWFRNLTLFRFTEPFTLTAEELEARLSPAAFQPCGRLDFVTYGWIPPLGRKARLLTHAANGCVLFCLQTEEKVLPAAVVKDMVTARVDEIEERESRPVRRRERETLRDEIYQDLLPRAFTRSRQSYAYIDLQGGWLIIDASAQRTVDDLTRHLRKSLGSLPIAPLRPAAAPASIMTDWLARDSAPADFALADECELRDDSGVVRCTGQDLGSAEIRVHLQAGKQVTRLALVWNERIELVLLEDLNIRRLRFMDVVREALTDIETDTDEQLFDAEFALMTGEIGALLPRLLEAFGGEVDQSAVKVASG